MSTTGRFRFTESAEFLALANFVAIGFAVWQIWNIIEILWIYWIQHLIIGMFAWFRILSLKQFSTKYSIQNGNQLEPTRATQRDYAIKFVFVVGILQFYFGFMISGLSRFEEKFLETPHFGHFICVVAFLINHGFSYFYNRQEDMKGTPNIGAIYGFPMIRVLSMIGVMWTGIIGDRMLNGQWTSHRGGWSVTGVIPPAESIDFLLGILVLKTLVDVGLHGLQRFYLEDYQTTH